MAKINQNYTKLKANYLFSDISQRVKTFVKENPDTIIYRLGIGNTTEPLPRVVIDGLQKGVEKLAHTDSYTGYGDEQGNHFLRQAIAQRYKENNISLEVDEIFVSDGAKPDIANMQSIFAQDSVVAIQDPVYPVYVDSNILAGKKDIVYLSATEENEFFPTVPEGKVDLIYICSPNNPTGAVATRKQLTDFVSYAKEHKAIIIFDAAYDAFIQDSTFPRSIYEIEGSKECAIEINSFSKSAGFTGIRLGWSVVPKELLIENSKPGDVTKMWFRRQTTMFNGASNIAQEGGLAVLSSKGQEQCKAVVSYYMENARFIASHLTKNGFTVFGGMNAPYIWMKTINNLTSWEFFDYCLTKAHVVITPGVGFGSQGEGYMRLSAFGHKDNIMRAIASIEKNISL